MGIKYKRLDNNNFTGNSLDGFVRHQTVTECWRKTDNDWKLVPNIYEENWSRVQCRKMAEEVVHHINLDQTGFGALDGERIIGFATVSHRIFGVTARYRIIKVEDGFTFYQKRKSEPNTIQNFT